MAALAHFAAAILASASAASALYVNGSTVAPCDSPIYCYGDMLHQISLAQPFSDAKMVVDLPAKKTYSEIKAAFDKLDKPIKNNSALHDFLDKYFDDAGTELKEVPEDQLKTDPTFLDKIDDAVIKEFTEKVIDIWPNLTRSYNKDSKACSDCPNSFIPINRTFVISGGRFREPYYWDSYWVVEGLLRTGGSFIKITKNQIENFLDFIEQFGFVPNGARIYYLNRSQPPLLAQMVKVYVQHTNDTSILDRALPLLVKEHEWFMKNRSVEVKVGSKTYTLNHYAVQNTLPRPESYPEDWISANNQSYYSTSGIIYPQTEKLTQEEEAKLYANLATGAESGMDYSSRWLARPADAVEDKYFPLRSLNTKNVVPVDLNSILYGNEMAISEFYDKTGNHDASREWEEMAANRSEAIHAVMWNETLFSYFDYNLTSNAQSTYYLADNDANSYDKHTAPKGEQIIFHVGQFYPFWMGAARPWLKNDPFAVLKAFERVSAYLDERKGGIPATNLATGQQWDQPNVWPPLMYALMTGLLNTPATFGKDDPSFKGTRALALRLGQRYLDSAFCTWYATGGSTSKTPQLSGFSKSDTGVMFEKYADNATNLAGAGGEYEVVEGFGWTNGVLIWAVDMFGNQLTRPDCGNIEAANITGKRDVSAVMLSKLDSKRVKRFGRSLETEGQKRND